MLYTTNYNLNLYELEDDANLCDGYNNSMERIDASLYQTNSLLTSANNNISAIQARVGSLESSLSTVNTGNMEVTNIYTGCGGTSVTCTTDTANFQWLIVTMEDSNENQSTHWIRGGAQGQMYTHYNTVDDITTVVWGGLSCNGMTLANVHQLNMPIDSYSFEGTTGNNNISLNIVQVYGVSFRS